MFVQTDGTEPNKLSVWMIDVIKVSNDSLMARHALAQSALPLFCPPSPLRYIIPLGSLVYLTGCGEALLAKSPPLVGIPGGLP